MINYVYNSNPDLGTRELSQTSSYVFQLHIMSPHQYENIIICWQSHISRARYKHVKSFKKIMTVFPGLSVYSKGVWGVSLVVQWFRICLPKQGTQVWTLRQEDSTGHGQLIPSITSAIAQEWRVHALQQRSDHNEKSTHSDQRAACCLRLEKVTCTAVKTWQSQNKETHNMFLKRSLCVSGVTYTNVT